MNKFIFVIEIIAVVIALLFGIMWVSDPDGPYEPITFMALLFGTTIAEIVRRQYASPSAFESDVTKLSENVEQLLKQKNESKFIPPNEVTEKYASDENDDEYLNPTNERIVELLKARKNVLRKLEAVSEIQNISFDKSEPLKFLEKFSFPLSFHDGIVEVLNYTEDMTKHDSCDLQHSEWVDGLSYSICDYLDHLLKNIKNA